MVDNVSIRLQKDLDKIDARIKEKMEKLDERLRIDLFVDFKHALYHLTVEMFSIK